MSRCNRAGNSFAYAVQVVEAQTFFIRSVSVQNGIMAIVTALVVGLLFRAVLRRNATHAVLIILWGCVALWFFNSYLWGFSAVTVRSEGLELHYGYLSILKNTTLPSDSPWRIQRYRGGLRKLKDLYYFSLPGHESLKVRGQDKVEILKALGAAIDRLNGKPMGTVEERPVNL
jgi:hypothetical protein